MGTPGAGKGTQAKLLADRFGACHISTGDVLREAVRGGSPLGLEAKRYMEQGLLVPDDVVLARRGQPLGSVLLIALPREAALERLAGRRVCEQCGAMFHSSFDPPAQPDRCDRCGGRLVQRADDREETVRHRMEVYARETAPVLEHYRAAGLLCEIDGTGSREDVFRRVAASV